MEQFFFTNTTQGPNPEFLHSFLIRMPTALATATSSACNIFIFALTEIRGAACDSAAAAMTRLAILKIQTATAEGVLFDSEVIIAGSALVINVQAARPMRRNIISNSDKSLDVHTCRCDYLIFVNIVQCMTENRSNRC